MPSGLEPTLFGDVALVRHWGRIGTFGRQKIALFADVSSARAALDVQHKQKLRRGYRH